MCQCVSFVTFKKILTFRSHLMELCLYQMDPNIRKISSPLKVFIYNSDLPNFIICSFPLSTTQENPTQSAYLLSLLNPYSKVICNIVQQRNLLQWMWKIQLLLNYSIKVRPSSNNRQYNKCLSRSCCRKTTSSLD